MVKVHLQKKLNELDDDIKELTKDLDEDVEMDRKQDDHEYMRGELNGMKGHRGYLDWMLNYILNDGFKS